MFKPLRNTGRALVMADGWYEWKKGPDDAKIKQPYFIYHKNQKPIFFAAISRFHPDALDAPEEDGFVIVTAASDKAWSISTTAGRWLWRDRLHSNGWRRTPRQNAQWSWLIIARYLPMSSHTILSIRLLEIFTTTKQR